MGVNSAVNGDGYLQFNMIHPIDRNRCQVFVDMTFPSFEAVCSKRNVTVLFDGIERGSGQKMDTK